MQLYRFAYDRYPKCGYLFETVTLPEMGLDANVMDCPRTSAPVQYLSGAIVDFFFLPCNFCLLFFVLLKV